MILSILKTFTNPWCSKYNSKLTPQLHIHKSHIYYEPTWSHEHIKWVFVVRYSQTVLVVLRGAALNLPSCCCPGTLLPPGCAAVPQTRARCSPPSWKEWSTAPLLVRAAFLLVAVLHNLKSLVNTAILILCHHRKAPEG